MSSPIKTIVIIVAMQQEAAPFIEKHNLVEQSPFPFEQGSPMVAYSGNMTSDSGCAVAVHLMSVHVFPPITIIITLFHPDGMVAVKFIT
jgi:hypothetical protein